MATSEPIGMYALAYYLQRIRTFLESDKKTLAFPNISHQLQDVLVKIVTDKTEFLDAISQLNNNVKLEASKLTAMMDAHNNLKLVHDFDDGKYGPNVLMYRKIMTINALEPLRKPSEHQTPTICHTDVNSPEDSLVTSIFKTRCLNVSTKFVKDDTQLILQYPQMEPSQAEFLMNMLLLGKAGKETDVGYGFKSMYAPLWESMKLFSLKYEYKIECTSLGALKRVVFEKIPKFKVPEKMEVDMPIVTITPSESSSSSSSVSTASVSPVASQPNMSIDRRSNRRKEALKKNLKKLVNKLGNMIQAGTISEDFVHNSLKRISDFLFDVQQGSIVFEMMDGHHQYFLGQVERLCKEDMTYMLFTGQCQKYLGNIKYCLTKNMLYQIKLLPCLVIHKKNRFKNVLFEKLARFPITPPTPQELNKEQMENSIKLASSTHLTAPVSQNLQEKLDRFRAIKDNVIETSGEKYIRERLIQISDFLSTPKGEKTITFTRTTQGQALFIKYVHVLSTIEEGYPMFSSECQELLRSIKRNATRYKLKIEWRIDDTDETNKLTNIYIKKKLIGNKKGKKIVEKVESKPKNSLTELYMACRHRMEHQDQTFKHRSLSAGQSTQNKPNPGHWDQRRRLLKEGLSQPVQSDIALKMMQNMGWTGGGLGPRGDGLMVPLMPAMDITDRSGLGHVPKPNAKHKASKQPSNQSQVAPPTAELFPQVLPPAALPRNLVPPGIVSSGSTQKSKTMTVYLNIDYHVTVLKSILEMVTTDIEVMELVKISQTVGFKRVKNFVVAAVRAYNKRSRLGLNDKHQMELVEKTQAVFKERKDLTLTVETIDLNLVMKKFHFEPCSNKQCNAATHDLKTTDTQEPQLETTEIQKSQLETETQKLQLETEETQNSQLETIGSGSRWYSPVPWVTETPYGHENTAVTTKRHERLFEVKIKPQSIETTTAQQQNDMKTTNAHIPPDSERLELFDSQGIPTDFQKPKEIKTNTQEVQEAKTTISQKPQEVTTTPVELKIIAFMNLQRIFRDCKKSKTTKTQTPPDLKRLAFYCLQEMPIYAQEAKTFQKTITLKTQQRKTTTAKETQEMKTTIAQNLVNIITANTSKAQEAKMIITQKPQEIKTTIEKSPVHLSIESNLKMQEKSTIAQKQQETKTAISQQPTDITKANTSKAQEGKKTITQKLQEIKIIDQTPVDLTTENSKTQGTTTIAQKQQETKTTIAQNPTDITTANTSKVQEGKTTITQKLQEVITTIDQNPVDLTTETSKTTITQNPIDITTVNTSKAQEGKTTITQKLQEIKTTIAQNPIYYLTTVNTSNPVDLTTETSKTQKKRTITQKQQETKTTITQNPIDITTVNTSKAQEGKTTITQKQQETKTTIAQNPIYYLTTVNTSKAQEGKTTITQKLQEVITTIDQNPVDLTTENSKTQGKTTITQKQQETKTTITQNPIDITTVNTSKAQEGKTTITQKLQEIKTTIDQNPVNITTENNQISTELKTTATPNQQVKPTETQESQGDIFVKKVPANNNDTTRNYNAPVIVKKDNNVANNNLVAVKKEDIPATAQVNNNVTITPVTAQGKNDASMVKNEVRVVDYIDLTGDIIITTGVSNDETNSVQTAKWEIADGGPINNHTDKLNSQLDTIDHTCNHKAEDVKITTHDRMQTVNMTDQTETVTYIIPVDCEMKVESDDTSTGQVNIINNVQAENNTDQGNSNNTDKSNNEQYENDSLPDYEDDDCQIILDDSDTMIQIGSDDENDLLVSDNETGPDKALVEDREITKPQVSQKVENVLTNNSMESKVKTEYDNLDSELLQDRKRPSVDSPDVDTTKKCKLLTDFKKLCVLPKDYPQRKIDNEKACEIQTAILKVIDYTKENLPLLDCQGIQNGGLIYSCQDEKSVFFMEDLINRMDDLRIVYEFDVKKKICHKMAFRMNSFIEEPISVILKRLELCNSGLSATKWGVVKKEQYGDFIVIYVELDEGSFNYVCNANFVLYVGNDCAKFTIVWE